MPKVRHNWHDADDSDASFSPEQDDEGDELFDADEPEGDPDPDATSIDDFDIELVDDADVDFEDQLQLFGGNIHPPEYYQRALEEFNEGDFETEDYKRGTAILLDTVEEQWRLYVCPCSPLYTARSLTDIILIGTALS